MLGNQIKAVVLISLICAFGCDTGEIVNSCENIMVGRIRYHEKDSGHGALSGMSVSYIFINEGDSIVYLDEELFIDNLDIMSFHHFNYSARGEVPPGQKSMLNWPYNLSVKDIGEKEVKKLKKAEFYTIKEGKKQCRIEKHEDFDVCHYSVCSSEKEIRSLKFLSTRRK